MNAKSLFFYFLMLGSLISLVSTAKTHKVRFIIDQFAGKTPEDPNVFIAGSMVGVTGMFLALPMIAVLKIIFDRSEMFKQWGVLLGDENPERSPMRFRLLRSMNKKIGEKLQKQNDITPVGKKKE